MRYLDLDMEENAFDNFIRRKRRPKKRRASNKIEEVKESLSEDIKSSLDGMRLKKKNQHKNVLKRLRNPSFFSNRNNHKKIYSQVRKMAVEIDKLSKQLIDTKTKKKCGCKKKKRYSRFDGGASNTSVAKIWNDYKVPIIIGGALWFFLYSPMGKKMIKK